LKGSVTVVQVAGCRRQVTGCRLQVASCRWQVKSYMLHVTCNR